MSRRLKFTGQRWQELITQQRGSGLSVAEFCRRQGLAPVTFFLWRRLTGTVAAGAGGGLESAARARPAFVELMAQARQALPAAPPIAVLLPSGVRLQVLAGFDPVTLRQVAEALS